MTTKLWFVPTSKTLYSSINNTTYEYFEGRICGEVKDYGDSVGVIQGHFNVANFDKGLDKLNGVDNIINVSADTFTALNKANLNENIVFIFEIEETFTSSTFKNFDKSRLTLLNFESKSREYADYQFPFLRNYSSSFWAAVESYSDRVKVGLRDADVHLIINDFEAYMRTKNIIRMSFHALYVGKIIKIALNTQNIEEMQHLYMHMWTSQEKANNANYIADINDYLARNLVTNEKEIKLSELEVMYAKERNWATAYYMKKDEFEKTFKEVSNTNDEDWDAYSFIKFARGKLIVPINKLLRLGEHNATIINDYEFKKLLEFYLRLDIRSNHLQNFISNILLYKVVTQLNVFKKRAKWDFYGLQIMSLLLSSVVGFIDYSISTALLTYLICNILGIGKNLQQSNLAKIYIDVYEYCDLTTLMKYTKQMKNNGVTFNEETENYFVYIDKILATK